MNFQNTATEAPKAGQVVYRNQVNKRGERISIAVTVAKVDKILTRGQQAGQVKGFVRAFGSIPYAPSALSEGDPAEYVSPQYVTSTKGERILLTDLAAVPDGRVIS